MKNDILTLFQSFRTILCMCPHCNEIQRLGDLNLRYEGEIQKTWLDIYESKARSLDKKVAVFEEKEHELREKATEKGRQQVPIILKKSMSSEFMRTPYNPYDIKALYHPIDFIVFDGLHSSDIVSKIMLISRKTSNAGLGEIRDSIKKTVRRGGYNWQVARVDIDGKVTYGSK